MQGNKASRQELACELARHTFIIYAPSMATVIFDFDGTIADSFPVIVDVFQQLTHSTPLPPAEIQRLRLLPLHDLGRELHIAKWRIPLLLWRGRRLMKQRISEVEVFDGIPQVIAALHHHNHQLFVVSSNDTKAIEAFLKRHKLDNYFTQINGSVGLFAKAKSLQKMLNQNHINREDCYYIGDEVRDIEAALRLGIKQIAVTWGYNDATILKAYYPTALVNTPAQLLNAIE
jgi:phosphoglycolate phosphatase